MVVNGFLRCVCNLKSFSSIGLDGRSFESWGMDGELCLKKLSFYNLTLKGF